MNKKSVAASAVALLALAYVGGSWMLGKKVEEQYNAQLDKAAAMLGPGKLTSRSYDRGLFGSTSSVVVEIDLPPVPPRKSADGQSSPSAASQAAPHSVRLTIENKVRHGPFPEMRLAAAVAETRVTSIEGIDDATRQAFAKASAPRMTTVYDFSGDYTGQALLPAGEASDPEFTARWQALTYDFSGNAAGTRVEGQMQWPRLTAQGVGAQSPANMDLSLEGMRSTFDYELPQDGQWLMAAGQVSATIDKMNVAFARADGSAATPALTLNDVKVDGKTTRDGDLLDMAQTLVGRGTIAGTELDSIRLDMGFKHLDGRALTALQALATKNAQAASQGEQISTSGLQQPIAQLMAAKPEYRAKLSLSYQGQVGELSWGVVVQGAAAGQTAPDPRMPPQMLLLAAAQRVEGEATIKLPKSWLPAIAHAADNPDVTPESLVGMLSQFKAQGMLTEDDKAYSADLKYANGQALLNGKPLQGIAPRR